MSEKTTRSIICDSCGAEQIEHSSYPASYSLELKAIDVNINTSGITYAVVMNPPIDHTLHFCGLKCLGKWCRDEVINQ